MYIRLASPRLRLRLVIVAMSISVLACSLTVSVDPSTPARPTVIVNKLQATFLGQDGASFAGRLCTSGTTDDNVHIRLSGLRLDSSPERFRVDDPAQGGVWATPCDPVSNWMLHVTEISDGTVDLYFKPFRDAPSGTDYVVTVQYADGALQTASVIGGRVKP